MAVELILKTSDQQGSKSGQKSGTHTMIKERKKELNLMVDGSTHLISQWHLTASIRVTAVSLTSVSVQLKEEVNDTVMYNRRVGRA